MFGAISATVISPFSASSATLALKADP